MPRAAVPTALVPMKLAWIKFALAPALRVIPLVELPEMRFPAPAAVPPTVLPGLAIVMPEP